jgi:four helix bundle protein
MHDFRRLKVWQKAHSLTLSVYRVSASFPADEVFGLTAQMRRAAVSIGSNLAEGAGRNSDRDFARFVRIAEGSCHEFESDLLLARDLGYFPAKVFQKLDSDRDELRRMLMALRKRLMS